MSSDDDFQRELMGIFQAELEEHLGVLSRGLLTLEETPGPETRASVLTDLFRSAHSLKGAARAVGLTELGGIAHHLEDALSAVRAASEPLAPEQADALLAAIDLLRDTAAARQIGESPPAADPVLARLAEAIPPPGRTPAPRRPRPAVIPAAPAAPAGRSLLDRLSEFVPAPAEAPEPRPAPEPFPEFEPEPEPEPAPEPPPAPEPAPNLAAPPLAALRSAARPAAAEETIRVATSKLDALMDSLGELLVARLRAEQMLQQARAVQQRGQRWQKRWRAARPHLNRLRHRQAGAERTAPDLIALLDFLTHNEQELRGLTADLNALAGRLAADRTQLQWVVEELQTGIRNARLLPVGTLFDFFPRMVRDLARERGKEISLQISGADTQVDRQALELLKDPLTHLLRNAIDHGLEPPAEREHAGKPRAGVIQLRAEPHGSQWVLEVADDGRGINLDRVRRSAVERGLVTAAEAAGLGPEAVVDLIFQPGLSTAEQITDLSGRGVGMDVVRANLEQLRGVITVDTVPGAGTTFRLSLPLTLTTSHVLLVQAGGETVAVPVTNVERLARLEAAAVRQLEGQSVIPLGGRLLPLVELAHLLDLPAAAPPAPTEPLTLMVLAVAARRLAVRVDALLAEQEVVVKALGWQLRRVRNVAGAAVLGDGQLVMVLNPADLLKSALAKPEAATRVAAPAPDARRRRLLLVDDSITTRTMEKHILEAAGYAVTAAPDGRAAWELLQGCPPEALPDLIVSDIDMPRLDGLALTEAVKAEARLARLPVVLVTSRDTPAERLRGLHAGADAYLVKTAFDQQLLLETVGRLIG